MKKTREEIVAAEKAERDQATKLENAKREIRESARRTKEAREESVRTEPDNLRTPEQRAADQSRDWAGEEKQAKVKQERELAERKRIKTFADRLRGREPGAPKESLADKLRKKI